jgi:hypothetical protein
MPLRRTPPPRAGAADLRVLSIDHSDSAIRRRRHGFAAARVQRERGREETDELSLTETSVSSSLSSCFVHLREFKLTQGGFCKNSKTGPSSISTVAGTRVGSRATVYEFAHIKQGFVWRYQDFVSNCTSLTRYCTNNAITSPFFPKPFGHTGVNSIKLPLLCSNVPNDTTLRFGNQNLPLFY